ncbi:chemotaxis protein CheA [bacterium]|nr:chemotaxis protein CheA [bacterium]
MNISELIDALAQEALLLDPHNLQACGKMLSILEKIDNPKVEKVKIKLTGYLESLIMNDIDGQAPQLETIIGAVTEIQNRLKDEGFEAEAVESEKTRAEEKDTEETDAEETGAEIAEEAVAKQVKIPMEPESEPSGGMDEQTIEEPDLLRDFIVEANEHLDSIELNMVEWEKSPNDKEIINSIFRPFHTIKGVAGFLNLQKVNRLAHQLENLLDEARDNRIKLSPSLSDLIFDGVDILKSMITALDKCMAANEPIVYGVNIEPFIQRLSMFISSGIDAGDQADTSDDGEFENAPVQPIGEILVKEGKVGMDVLQKTLEKQAESGTQKKIGELLVEENAVTVRDVRDAIRKQVEPNKQTAEKHIKVDTTKMDQLLDTVGELVISETMVTHNPNILRITDQRLVRDLAQLQRVTMTLQSISMSMRLVPIGATFQKMNRIVRDLAKKSGKHINLVLDGQSAEIDRNMVEELYDPLVHMVRNSCDHGIKKPEERTANGKPPEGTIILKAEHTGGKVAISISDDGDGLDRERILQKAREKGIIKPEERPDDKEIDHLIFMPGFSTAQQVTDVSGRGVGMDVVRKAIEKLRGTVEIHSKKGEGTTFIIKLPLTTAIIDGMLVQIGEERYIIPTLSVRQLVRPEEQEINTVVGRGKTAMIRGKLLPLIKLSEVLGIENGQKDTSESVLVVVEDSERVVALQVDSLLGKQEVVIKTLGEQFKDLKGVAGGAILGDGKIGLILDVRSIINSDEIAVGIG